MERKKYSYKNEQRHSNKSNNKKRQLINIMKYQIKIQMKEI